MNDLINLLQTMALVLTLLLVIFILLWIVYAFRKFVVLFNHLLEEMDNRVIDAPKAEPKVAAESVVAQEAEPPAPAPELPRQKCKTCNAKLSEIPVQSRINGESTILVFKCRRCGKETEVELTEGT